MTVAVLTAQERSALAEIERRARLADPALDRRMRRHRGRPALLLWRPRVLAAVIAALAATTAGCVLLAAAGVPEAALPAMAAAAGTAAAFRRLARTVP
ncbi:DUF3040 domain-containing protein [Kitasatospora sp. NBC_01539]|uniref:DUF3040 domain-containing protein n=1 Tax=Kitasatospora sp. NBC_01539 TaxID=2903577 RepID=UPI003860212A